MKYYVAYGSNLNLGQMKTRCPKASCVGTAFLNGYKLLFKGSKTGSYLTVEESDDQRVPVAIFKITDDDEKALDIYEGYPNFYYKKSVDLDVKLFSDDEKVERLHCFYYVMHENRPLGIPTKFYLLTCKIGYDDFGFDIKYLKDAFKRSV